MSRLQQLARRGAMVAVLGLLAFAAAGCAGSSHSKAGAEASGRVIVLHMAVASAYPTAPDLYAQEVSRLSGGSLRIEIGKDEGANGLAASETSAIREVRAGKAQLGWVYSRAWSYIGVKGFEALIAPFLVDTLSLQQKVLASALAKRMLASVRPLGLVGLGIFPGTLKRMLGVRKVFRGPADFARARIVAEPLAVAEATMRALGATPVGPVIRGGKLQVAGSDGYALNLSSIYGNQLNRVANALTTNIDFWPRPLVAFTSRKVYDSLSDSQRQALAGAAKHVLADYTAVARADDAESLGGLCRVVGRFKVTTASPAQVAALRRAVRPVYRSLDRDPETRSAIRTITTLRRRLRIEPAQKCAKQSPAARRRKTPLDGVYRAQTTREQEAKREGVAPARVDVGNFGTVTLVLDRGRFADTNENTGICGWDYGTFTLGPRTLSETFTHASPSGHQPGDLLTYGFSLYRETLTLNGLLPPSLPDKALLRISKTPSRRYLSRHCPPPAKALSR